MLTIFWLDITMLNPKSLLKAQKYSNVFLHESYWRQDRQNTKRKHFWCYLCILNMQKIYVVSNVQAPVDDLPEIQNIFIYSMVFGYTIFINIYMYHFEIHFNLKFVLIRSIGPKKFPNFQGFILSIIWDLINLLVFFTKGIKSNYFLQNCIESKTISAILTAVFKSPQLWKSLHHG